MSVCVSELMTDTAGPWFRGSRESEKVAIRLFCFPYAGGAALVYRDWEGELPSSVQVIPVELPGRGARLKERPLVSLPLLTTALSNAILPLIDKPFAFFGHSMGALIAFELARCLRRQHERQPELLLVSGRRAPQVPDRGPVTYDLPDDEFVGELHRIAGTPEEVLEHEELMELMIPVLRADFRLTQTYEYGVDTPLRCPIVVYGGLDDEVTRDVLQPWEEQTSSAFALHLLPGGHFFLRSSRIRLLGLIREELHQVIARLT